MLSIFETLMSLLKSIPRIGAASLEEEEEEGAKDWTDPLLLLFPTNHTASQGRRKKPDFSFFYLSFTWEYGKMRKKGERKKFRWKERGNHAASADEIF